MTELTKEQAIENIYKSLEDDNNDIDTHIMALKEILKKENTNVVTVEPARLIQNNRQGRKLMQAYFKKRGVIVTFKDK